MGLPRVLLDVRRMMLAVGFLAIVMGLTREANRLRGRRREYDRKALLACRELRGWRNVLLGRTFSEQDARQHSTALRSRDADLAELWAEEASGCAREVVEALSFVAYYDGLHQKYRRAASRPWEAVAPDPPEPRHIFVWRCTPLPREPLPPGRRWYSSSEDAERRRKASLTRSGRTHTPLKHSGTGKLRAHSCCQ